ncbi:hemerythrin domain-containing protein [Janibacter anophelis]|uniref:hemerythrin domain-containing protein n=1 Tax=Janibacter anophelis TaxID=319054 RepID=UPI000831AFAC|nr:hemerythrin domain-containing protein [Janibacter anophelis]
MSIARDLEAEHRSIDALLEQFVSGLDEEVRPGPFRDSARELRQHIHVEEAHLFPPLREAGIIPPVLVMLREHGQIWTVLDEIDAHLDDEPDPAELRRLCEMLTDMLGAHNDKEEAILYRAAVEVLDPVVQEQISNAMVDDTLPDGWRCEMA